MGIQMLKLHWKAAKWPMLPVLIGAFGLPLMAGRLGWGLATGPGESLTGSGWNMVVTSSTMGLLFPFLAMATGAIVALSAWNADHQAGHIYPLSLPIARWKYAALKYGGGVIILAGTGTLFLAGATITTATLTLPVGLNAYPLELSGRFMLASLTAYSALFALASGTMRTAVLTLSALGAVLIFGNGMLAFVGNFVPGLTGIDVVQEMHQLLLQGSGPLRVFSGNWSLIDV